MNKPISSIQVYMILMISIAINNHVMVVPLLLGTSGRDAWMSVFISFFTLLPIMFLIAYIAKHTHQEHLISWIKQKSKPLAWVLQGVVGLWLLLTAIISLKDMVNWANIAFLQFTPPSTLLLTIGFACYYGAYKGIRSIAIVTGILLPIVIILGYFAAFANLGENDYTLLKPFLEYGFTPVVKGSWLIDAALIETALILFLQHRVRNSIKFTHLLIYLILMLGLTAGPTMAAIVQFGVETASLLRFPAYDEWRIVRIGKYIEHVDFLAIFKWLSGSLVRISLCIYLFADLFRIKSQKKQNTLLIAVTVVIFAGFYIPMNDMQFFRAMKSYYPVSLLTITACLAAIFVLILFQRKGG